MRILFAVLTSLAMLVLTEPQRTDAFGRSGRTTVQNLSINNRGVQFQQIQTRGVGRVGGGFYHGSTIGPAHIQSQLLIHGGRRTQLQQFNSFGSGYLPGHSVQNIRFHQHGTVQQLSTGRCQNIVVPQQIVQPQVVAPCVNSSSGTTTTQDSAQYLQQTPVVVQSQVQQPAPVVVQPAPVVVQPAPVVVQQEVAQYVVQQPMPVVQYQQQSYFQQQAVQGAACVPATVVQPSFVQFQRIHQHSHYHHSHGASFLRATPYRSGGHHHRHHRR